VFSASDFLRRSSFFSRASSAKFSTLPLQSLMGPVLDVPDSFRMEETLAAQKGRRVILESMAQYVAYRRREVSPEARFSLRPGATFMELSWQRVGRASPVFLGLLFSVGPDRTIHQRAHGTPTQTGNAFQVCVKRSGKFNGRRN
jgi:hypothetical protein